MATMRCIACCRDSDLTNTILAPERAPSLKPWLHLLCRSLSQARCYPFLNLPAPDRPTSPPAPRLFPSNPTAPTPSALQPHWPQQGQGMWKGPAYFVVHDLSVGLHKRLRVEGRFPVKHLVHADAQRPPVTLGAVLAHAVLHGLQDLRRDVVRRAHGHRRPHLGRGRAQGNLGRRQCQGSHSKMPGFQNASKWVLPCPIRASARGSCSPVSMPKPLQPHGVAAQGGATAHGPSPLTVAGTWCVDASPSQASTFRAWCQ